MEKRREPVRRIGIVVLFVLALGCFSACTSHKNNVDGLRKEEITVTPTGRPAQSNTPIITGEPLRETTYRLAWEVFSLDAPTPESSFEINRLLQEKGLDVTVDFINVGMLSNEDNEKWISEQEKSGTIPDILNTGIWSNEGMVKEYLQKRFFQLNDFLATNEGARLKSTFSRLEWGGASFDSNIYVIPKSLFSGYDYGVYLSVRDEYASRFLEFDGTFESLMRIYTDIGEDWQIIVDDVPEWLVYSFLGYHYYLSLPYDENKHEFINPINDERLEPLLDGIFSNLSKGIFVYSLSGEYEWDHILAQFHLGAWPRQEGFTDICVCEDIGAPRLNNTYGVSVASDKKELALQVLTACYSDPRIEALLFPENKSAILAEERADVMKTKSSGELTGFLLSVPKDIMSSEMEYKKALRSLSAGMFVLKGDKYIVSLQYQASARSNALTNQTYTVFLDEANRQVTEFLKKRDRE